METHINEDGFCEIGDDPHDAEALFEHMFADNSVPAPVDTRAEVIQERLRKLEATEADQLRKLAEQEDPTFGIF